MDPGAPVRAGRRARGLALAVAWACAWGVGAPAQEADSAAPPGAPPSVGHQLSLGDAFRIALSANQDVRVAALEADRSEALVERERGRFDAELEATAGRAQSRAPTATDPVGRARGESARGAAGVQKRAAAGTTIGLDASADYSKDHASSNALDPEYAGRIAVSVRQDLLKNLGPGINLTPVVVQQNNAAISKEALRDTLIETVYEVERAYWDLYFALADVKVRQQQWQRATELVRIAEARVEVGDAPPIEVSRAQSSAANQAVEILNARNQASRQRRRLLDVMGVLNQDLAVREIELSDDPPHEPSSVTVEEALDVARRARPDLAQAELDIENASLRERFERNQRLPTLQLYGEAGLLGLDDEPGASAWPDDPDTHEWEVGVRLAVPWPNREARAGYRAARIERRQAAERAERLRQTITRQVADALEDLATASDTLVQARRACDLARRLLDAEEKSFNLGRTESFNVLSAQAAMATAERDEIRARTGYATSLANLCRVQGNLLDVKRIAFVPESR